MRLLTIFLALGLLLAGCAEPTTDEESTDAPAGDAEDDGGGGTADDGATEAGGGNPDVNRTLASFSANATMEIEPVGGAPFNVTLGSDLPSDAAANATWSADVLAGNESIDSQEGTGLPAVLNLTLDPGNYTLSVVVSADGYEDATTELSISVVDGAPAIPPPQETITISDSISGAYIGVGYTGSNSHSFEVTQYNAGMVVSLDWGTTAIDLDYDIFAPDGTEVASHATFNEPTGTVFSTREPDTAVDEPAEGSWTIDVYPGESAAGDYTFTITFS